MQEKNKKDFDIKIFLSEITILVFKNKTINPKIRYERKYVFKVIQYANRGIKNKKFKLNLFLLKFK